MHRVSDYDYQLPAELIAQHPPAQRTDSRMLKMDAEGNLTDLCLVDIVREFKPGDLMVMNNTRVIPARVYGRKESGGRIEILLERILSENECLVQIRSSRSPKVAAKLLIDEDGDVEVTVVAREDGFFRLHINTEQRLVEWFAKVGHMPLPPYIDRQDQLADRERYQTVFAQCDGAVAAPTAGLHFDQSLLEQIQSEGVELAKITLHVGAGTYQPVRVESIEEHKMHQEWVEVSPAVCDKISQAKARGGRIFAIGTTVVRALESAARGLTNTLIEPFTGDTDIFIYPGFEFKVVDRLLTNYHLPQSTLLMLVSAFCGREKMLNAYQHAIAQRYRFFSYGDAMLLERMSLEPKS